jgi:hypothetical protein
VPSLAVFSTFFLYFVLSQYVAEEFSERFGNGSIWHHFCFYIPLALYFYCKSIVVVVFILNYDDGGGGDDDDDDVDDDGDDVMITTAT